jgi:IclR family transcriptional regulator, pca regulon regulatory protein
VTTQVAMIDRDREDTAGGEERYALTLGRGLEVLTCFTPERPVLDVHTIANELAISRPTAYRFAATLERAGYLVRDKTSEGSRATKFRLGFRVLDLGSATLSGTSMAVHARPIVHGLRAATAHRVTLAVLAGPNVAIVESAASYVAEHLLPDARVGSQLPAYCTGLGKVLLAALPVAQQSRQLGAAPLKKRLRATITNREALAKALRVVRRAQFAESVDESWPDVSEIAVPVVGYDGEVIAALGIVAHSSLTTRASLRKCLPRLTEAAAALSAFLGDPQQRASAALDPLVVGELRAALVDEVLAAQAKLGEVADATVARQARTKSFKVLADGLKVQSELQEAIGWPDDPMPKDEVTVSGKPQLDLAIRCLRRRLDGYMNLDSWETVSAQTSPARRSLKPPEGRQADALSEVVRAIGDFLAANGSEGA